MSSILRVGSAPYSGYGQLASGKKLQTAADGAAELAIVQKQKVQTNGYDTGNENMQSGKSVLNISDGALASVGDYLQRIQELALRASGPAMSDSDKRSIQNEIDQMKQGIADVADQTSYNGQKLLDGSIASFDLATNANGSKVSVENANATLDALGIADFDVTKNFNMKTIYNAMDKVSEMRSTGGAKTNALDYAMRYNASASYNLTSASSRLEDLDYPKAVSDLKKNELLRTYSLLMQRKQQENEARKVSMFWM